MDKQQVRDEIIRCGKDPNYFIRTYVKIQHPIRGLIPFAMFDYQESLVEDYRKNRFNIVLKARQLGISEVTAAYAAWLMLFHRDKNILVMATKSETAKNIIRKIQVALKKIPKWLMLSEVIVDNKMSLELSNGSRIKAIAKTSDAGRSEALSLLIVDEAAHIDNLEELWTGLYPTVSAGGRVIMLSTPNGVGNLFHKLYVESEQGLNDFKNNKLMWWVHPERVEGLRDDPSRPGFKLSEWYLKEIRSTNMSIRDVAQELECLRAGTRIVTPDGFKRIEDIVVGDLVLTHRGRFREVVRLFSKETTRDEIVKVSLPMSRKNPVYITKNHPVLTDKGDWVSFADDPTQKTLRGLMPRLDISLFKNSLFSVDLAKISSTRFTEVTDKKIRYRRQRRWTDRNIGLDYDFGRILGLYLAEGYGDDRVTNFAFHRDEKELIEFVKKWACDRGMSTNIQSRDYSQCTVVSISNYFLRDLLQKFVSGHDCHTKILTDQLFLCSSDVAKGVIDGIWEGDGLHRPDKKNCLRLANERLIYQIRILMTAFGLFTRVSSDGDRSWYVELNNIDGRPMRECTSRGFFEKKQSRCVFGDGMWWGRVSVSPADDIEEELTVYNIEVAEDNSYVCENLVVHNCNFNASGDTVITAEHLENIYKNLSDPAWRYGQERNLFVWHQPERTKQYMISADVARGDGKDYSAFHVWDVENMMQMAEYYGKVPPDAFAEILVDTGKLYNNALLVVENNTIGLACIEHIKLKHYPNVFYSRKGDRRPGEAVNTYFGPMADDLIPGFTTSPKTRPLMVNKLEEYIRNGMLHVNGKRFYEELRTFIWVNGRPEAMRGYNDDLVMAAAIGAWIRDTVLAPNFITSEVQKKLIENIGLNQTVHTDIKGAAKDPRFVNQRTMGTFQPSPSDPYKMQLPNGVMMDFSWVISKG